MCWERSSSFLPLQCPSNVWGLHFLVTVSEFLLLAQCFTLVTASSLCSTLPTSFIPQSDANTGFTEDFRIIEGVQNRNQLKIELKVFLAVDDFFLPRLYH